jgi:2-polyprenyl-3-methyl-5-hydroxy-6-metoxy-1,4-benzoquinol methylase
MTTAETTAMPSAEEFVGRLLEATVGAMDIFSVYLGEQLGYYRALHEGGPATSALLAERTGTQERYTREWLEQQATTGILQVDDAAAGALERRYRLPEGYEAVLVDPVSDAYAAPLGRFLTASVRQAQALVHAFRNGGGVSWAAFGDEARTAQADFNRPFFENHLAQDYLAQVPGLADALNAPGARIAEVGSGGGWASIAMARAFPQARVDGIDIDEPSVAMANANAREAGLADRVHFHAGDAGQAELDGQCDLVCAFECIHDMSDPVSALRAMRRLAKPGGVVLVMDERVGDQFGNIGDLVERLFYGFSIAVCLPDGMSHQPSAGTGTVMRPPTLRKYAQEAGFREIEVLPLEHDLFNFYRLIQ